MVKTNAHNVKPAMNSITYSNVLPARLTVILVPTENAPNVRITIISIQSKNVLINVQLENLLMIAQTPVINVLLDVLLVILLISVQNVKLDFMLQLIKINV
jgi:hypothetical protein